MRHFAPRVFSMVMMGVLSSLGCGGSSDSLSGSDTFSASDTLSSSIFTAKAVSFPAGIYRLRVVSTGVSSGFVKLNDEEILGPSDFHNKSFDETVGITLQDENTIEYEIRGKPGDQLCVRVYELNDDDTERGIYEGCVDRTAGPPNNVEVTITPTPTPTPTP